jgi:hypothetical protein
VTPPELPKAFFTSPSTTGASDPTSVGPSDIVLSGGKAKRAKKPAAKPAAKKPAAKKPAGKKGGSLAHELKSLAVPFAILLAKQGLDGMFDSKKSSSKKAIEATSSSSKRKAAVGGGCSSCATPPPMAGGSKSGKSRYAQLAKEIDEFLSKY